MPRVETKTVGARRVELLAHRPVAKNTAKNPMERSQNSGKKTLSSIIAGITARPIALS
jgi:hypothetical protein